MSNLKKIICKIKGHQVNHASEHCLNHTSIVISQAWCSRCDEKLIGIGTYERSDKRSFDLYIIYKKTFYSI